MKRALAAALCLLLGCGPRAAAPTTARAAEHGAISSGNGPLAAERVRRIGDQVASLRHLAYLRDVPVSFVDAATFEDRAVESMATAATESVLTVLSDVAPEEGYRRRARYFMAIYSPKRQHVYVRQRLPAGWSTSDLEALLAHELVHALQFQHFTPEREIEARKRRLDIDGVAALNAFLEGEAELIAVGFSAVQRGAPPRRAMIEVGRERTLDTRVFAAVGQVNEALSQATRSQQENELFPYQFGPFFAAALYRSGGARLLNAAWASPPATSREIFEPARYLQRAQKFTLADLPLLPHYEPRISLSMGAIGFYQITSSYALANESASSEQLLSLATHVVGDRLTFAVDVGYGRPMALFACWLFDDDTSARRAAELLRSEAVWSFGRRVVLISGAPREQLDELAQRYADLAVRPASVGARPAPRALAALPSSVAAQLHDATSQKGASQSIRALLGGLRLEGEGVQRGPGAAWVAHLASPRYHAFLSVLGDGVSDGAELVSAFKKGLVMAQHDVVRTPLGAVSFTGLRFDVERLSWASSAALVLDAPVCRGVSRLALSFVPAPAELTPELALGLVRGLDELEGSPYCTRVQAQRRDDLPEP